MMLDGFGALAMSPLLHICFTHYGYTGAMVILAGLTLQFTVGGALLRDPFPYEIKQEAAWDESPLPEAETDSNISKHHACYLTPPSTMENIPMGSIDDLYFYTRRMSRSFSTLNLDDGFSPDRRDLRRGIWFSHGDITTKSQLRKPDSVSNNDIQDSGMPLTPNQQVELNNELEHDQRTRTTGGKKRNTFLKYFDYTLLGDRRYLAFTFICVCMAMCGSTTSTHFAGLCKERHLSITQITTLLATMGGVNMSLKFLSGFLFDWKLIKPFRTHVFCFMGVLISTALILAPYAVNITSFWTTWLLFTSSAAILGTQESLVLADIVTSDSFASAIGLNRFFRGFGVLLGPTFGGKMANADATSLDTFWGT